MLKIALLYDCPYPFHKGGGEYRLYKIAQKYTELGYVVDWYSFKYWSGDDAIFYDNINYISVGTPKKLYLTSGKRSAFQALSYGFRIARQFNLRNYDVIHAGQWPIFHLFAASIYSLFKPKILIIDWWETWGRGWMKYARIKGYIGYLLERLALSLPAKFITISDKGYNDLINAGVSSNKICNVNNGIDFDIIQAVPAKNEKFDLVYLGRLKDHKNVSHIIHALSIIKAQGVTLTLQIIGDGEERVRLEKLVQKYNLKEQVLFFGQLDSNEECYARMKASKLFIHPSTKEGGGSITVFEANACGLPVVAYKYSDGIDQSILTHKKNGYWVSEVGPKYLANAIIDALSIEYDRSVIISGVKKYAWEQLVIVYAELLSNLPIEQ